MSVPFVGLMMMMMLYVMYYIINIYDHRFYCRRITRIFKNKLPYYNKVGLGNLCGCT